ncbi:DsbA family oxidoreductase [Paenibacillus graminis]|uniref:DsbA family oxidoreductase n=1 Tax=Paenibacillus graminis TaxID=189425 RepID=UPI002DC03C0B|nr:DsbA family oxidoreductase [Paenibacillus graminis]MEC0167819.1 DsbA family oxidoreductase [Paenibacillus graminis]
MRIDVWSDNACPFCYIGKRRLEHALSQFEGQDKVEVVFRSFQLDPSAPVQATQDVYDMLAAKYGMTREKAIATNAQLAEQAKGVGLEFNFDAVQHTNTFDSHRLAHYAASKGKGAEMSERLLGAYFTDGHNLADRQELASLAGEVGLDKAEAAAMLETDAFADAVNADIAEGERLNITGVPFFVFNNKYAVSGAQPGPVFSEVLDTVWAEEKNAPELQVIGQPQSKAPDAEGCDDGSCSI